ncbi:MAG: NAD(P)-dependent oxidoreductase [Planctomycetota bacterium]|jgi:2-hydroxy-3-oxopropionate reductase|nr:NAD(P)-dependent oxidoreductase [Planctomycetota bacterium]
MKPVLGFVGLGIMGRPMAINLLKAGYAVHINSLLASEVESVAAAGGIAEASAFEVAGKADISIVMVPNTPQVEAILFGDGGMLPALGPGKIVVDMSTIAALPTREFAERVKAAGARLLDAPVSGGDKGAIAGTLSIMVGGEAEAFERCKPIFEVLGKRITHVGGNGAGQGVKSCCQVLSAATMAAIGEAMAMGVKAGVEAKTLLEVMSAGYCRCGCLEIRGEQIVNRNFEPGFKSKLQYKDLNLALELARGLDVPMPIASLVTEFYKSCMAKGLGEEDHSNVVKVVEEMAGVIIGGKR